MNIDDMTIKEAKELASLFGKNKGTEHPYKIGESYLIRTVTMIIIGKLQWVGDLELLFSDAAWIADTGRFHDALKKGTLNEIEPFVDDVIVGRTTIIDGTKWNFSLLRTQK
jgi:hypothetical protein